MARLAATALILTVAAVAGGARPACADIYVFRDARGVTHFSDRPLGPGYKIYHRSSFGRAGIRAARRFRGVESRSLKVRRQRYASLVDDAARRYDLDSALLDAIITTESGYNPSAISSKGAQGLMQLMPGTAERYGVMDCWDPADNLEGGARYLHDLLRMFDDDVRLAVAAYNAGENAVLSYGNTVPPYGETQRYVDKVLDQYRRHRSID
jgi:soluble lytic murein transglycosylase-like protein